METHYLYEIVVHPYVLHWHLRLSAPSSLLKIFSAEIAADEEASLALSMELQAAEESEMQALQAQIAGDAEKVLGYYAIE